MTLSKADIQRELGYGDLNIKIQWKDTEVSHDEILSVEPSSIDLHLGDQALITQPQDWIVEVDDESTYPTFEEVKPPFTIPPFGFALAHTAEVVNIPDYLVGFLHGRSSVGRLGLFIHNAGLVDAGFHGDLTLELFNSAPYPIKLKKDMRICQMTLHEHDSVPSQSYSADQGNKYNGQRGPTPSQLYKDF